MRFKTACIPVAITVLAVSTLQATDIIATGLNNPRGLAFGPEGILYVAEAGTGGAGPCGPAPGGGQRCFGLTGSITGINLAQKTQTRIATGFPSLAAPDGTGANGVHDISFQGLGNGFLAIGMGGDPDRKAFGLAASSLAHLARMMASGNWSALTDLLAYEVGVNPDGLEFEANPYSVLALPGKQLVVDAGANALLEIASNGNVRTLAVFPDRLVDAPPFLGLPPGAQIPMDAVPTTVVQGPDGAYYVGELTGFPFPPGGANVYRVPAEGGTPTIARSGFTNIIDIDFGPDGSLYVLEISKDGLLSGSPLGALIRVLPNGTRTEIVPGALFLPGGVAFGPDGIYVTTWAVLPGDGQVVRVNP